MKLFDKDNDVSIVIEKGATESVCLTARDRQDNLRRLSDKQNGFVITSEEYECGIFINTSY